MPYIPPSHGFGSSEEVKPIIDSKNSAVKALDLYGDNPLSFQDYYVNQGYGSGNPYDFWHKIDNFFSGNVSSAEQAYNNYLNDYYNKQTFSREDSAVQRMLADYQKAGLNPYLIVNSGGSISAASSQAQKSDSENTARKRTKNGSILGTALKLLAILALKG